MLFLYQELVFNCVEKCSMHIWVKEIILRLSKKRKVDNFKWGQSDGFVNKDVKNYLCIAGNTEKYTMNLCMAASSDKRGMS